MAVLGNTKITNLTLLDGVIGDLNPVNTDVYNLGTSSLRWNNLYAKAIYGTTQAQTDNSTAMATTAYVRAAINALDVAVVGGTGKYISAISQADGKISATAVSTSVSNTWTAGTTSGPTISTTVNGVTGTAVAVPSASISASGIVTTGSQIFKGNKTFGFMTRRGQDDSGNASRWVADTYLNNFAGARVGEFWYDIGDATNITTGKYTWRQYSPQSTAATTTTGHYEDYSLPAVTKGLTENVSYNILTTKSTITVGQGGTGATTAAAAWTALGGGASGKHADDYFALAGHNHNGSYLTAVGYDSTNKKIYYIKNGSNTDVVTFGSNAFNSTSYLPLAGGVMTGNIRRYYSASSTEPMITMLSNNQDILLWEAGHGTEAGTTTTSNHYKLMYKGSGSDGDNSNYLQLIAHKTDDVVAIQIDEIGNVSLPQMNKGSATKPIYLNNGVITEGTALKDLAYIAKGSGSTKFLREDGTWQTALTSHQSLSAYATLASPALTGTPTAPTAADGTNNTQIATTAFVMSQFKYNDAMIYKGVVNANGNLPATHYQGWTYKVGTAGTYAGIVCEAGDMIICNTDGTSANNAHWNVIQTNIDGAVIGPSSSTDGNIVLFDGTTGKIIKNSTYSPSSFAAASHGTHVTTATVQSALSINTSSGSTSKCLTEKGTFVAFNNYSHPTGDGNLHVPATGTSNNGKFLKAGSTAGSASWSDLPAASDSVAGITKVGASGGAAAYSHGTHVTTSTVQSALSINTSSGSTSKCLTEKGTFVAFNNYSLPLAANGTRGGIQIGYSESGTNYAVKLSSEKAYVSVPWTDTKVTSSSNHYSPTTASGSDKTASASGATAAWSIDVVKGITINTDGKGHITGLSVTSGKIPANPNTDTKVKQSAITTADWRKVLLHYKNDTTSTTAVTDSTEQVYGCVGISAQASTGTLRASKYNVNDKVTLQWNDTDQSLDFVFA